MRFVVRLGDVDDLLGLFVVVLPLEEVESRLQLKKRLVARDGGEAKFVVVSHLEMTSVVLSPGCGSSSFSSSTSFSSTSPFPPLLSFTQVVTLGSAGPEKQDL